MIVHHDKCPACLSNRTEQIAHYKNYPAILFPIEKEKRNRVATGNLQVFKCDTCGHLFLNDMNLDFNRRIYGVYYYLYPFKNLESMQRVYRDPFEKVFDFFYRGDQGSLLEIGCDNEQQMRKFVNSGVHCTAINPGATNSAIVEFIDGYYEDGTITGLFDYIVSRFNLEHIIDLDRYFENIAENLQEDGVALVQVPNVEMFLKINMLNVFAHEHPHYFCKTSFRSLIERTGYEILYLSEAIAPSLICAFRKTSAGGNPAKRLQTNESILKAIQLFLQQSAGKQVIFYGAGLTLSGILYSGQIDSKLLRNLKVIDDNPILHGRYMPNTCVRIESPIQCNVDKDTTILLTLNKIYYPTVINKLAQRDVHNIFGINDCGIYKVS